MYVVISDLIKNIISNLFPFFFLKYLRILTQDLEFMLNFQAHLSFTV